MRGPAQIHHGLPLLECGPHAPTAQKIGGKISAVAKRKRTRPAASDAGRPVGEAGGSRALSPRAAAALVFAWACLVHGATLAANPLVRTPVSAFFYGDGPIYLEQGRRLAEGLPLLNFGLPYHPPLVAWLCAPLWWLFGEPSTVFAAAKCLMILLLATGYALFYRLVRDRLPQALLACLLLPLNFGELALASTPASETVYRLLLLVLFALGWRRPLAAGAVHGLAALARPEHLGVGLLAAAVVAWRAPARRKYVGLAAAGTALVLVPYALSTAATLSAYNRAHASELAEPLPVLVPVSFYGPLNFALAQREEGIHFSRRTLPPAPSDAAALDPTFPPHNEAIVHGYRLGLAEIAARPGRFVARTAAKLGYSATALGFGWTWRDLPRPGRWVRQPVDVASAESPIYLAVCLLLAGLGAWALRADRRLLAVALALLVYRLGVNAAFFPYLRGMMVIAPLYLAFQVEGFAFLLRAFLLRRHAARGLAALLALLAVYHFATVWTGSGKLRLSGERSADGTILDDRPVVIERSSASPGVP